MKNRSCLCAGTIILIRFPKSVNAALSVKVMKNILLESIGYVDAKYLDKAENYVPKKKNTWVKWNALAACQGVLLYSQYGRVYFEGYGFALYP